MLNTVLDKHSLRTWGLLWGQKQAFDFWDGSPLVDRATRRERRGFALRSGAGLDRFPKLRIEEIDEAVVLLLKTTAQA